MAQELKNYDPAIMAGASVNVNLDLGEILDANSNEMLEFDTVASAVNFLRMANAATGNEVDISAQGDDTNVAISITPKGSGTVKFVMATTASITTGGAWDASLLGGSDPAFILKTTTLTAVTAVTATSASTAYVAVQLSTGTTRFLRVYD